MILLSLFFLTTIILHIFTGSIQCFFLFLRLRKWTLLVLQQQAAMTFNSYKSKENTSSLRFLQKDPHLGRGREYDVLRVEKWKGWVKAYFCQEERIWFQLLGVSIFHTLCLEPFVSGLWSWLPSAQQRPIQGHSRGELCTQVTILLLMQFSYSILLPAILLTRILSTVQNAFNEGWLVSWTPVSESLF